MICTECGFRRDRGFDHACFACEKPLCRSCAEKTYVDLTDDDEGLNCEGCECTKCKNERLKKERQARGEWTASELEEQGQLNLLKGTST